MDQKQYMRPLELAGRLIMENGGETYRVEETVNRMGAAFGLKGVESFAVPSGIFLSFECDDGSTETAVLRVHRGDTDLERVDEVNRISRQVEAGELNCEEALEALEEIAGENRIQSPALRMAAAAVCSGGFAVMFGGTWKDFLFSSLLGLFIEGITELLRRHHLQSMVSLLFGSFLATLIPICVSALLPGLSLVTEAIIAGALMPMLPGLAMTNAVSDTMRGDLMSGISHFAEAVLTAALVAGGALVAAAQFRVMGGMIR